MAVAIGFVLGRGTAPDPDPERRAAAPTPAPTATPDATPGTSVVEPDGSLALGITEENPNFLAGDAPPPWETWRDALSLIAPTHYRLVISWADVVEPDGTFHVDKPQAGCLRDKPPCAGWAGVRGQIEALAAAQARSPGRFQVLTTIYETPEPFARAPSGCERAGTLPRSRPPRRDAFPAYQDVISQTLAEGRRAGVELRLWSPWNEPNHPYFISPQRTRCDPDAPSASVPAYVELARAMQATLDAEPGEQELLVAETGGLTRKNTVSTELGEFVRALPSDLVCGTRAFTQHAYAGMKDPVEKVASAIATHDCPRAPEIWITETGAKTTKLGAAGACAAVHERLARWWADPRVTAAFQYTLREDDQFPTGLVSTDLTTPYPALGMWQAWAAREAPTDPPPPDPC